MASAAPPGSLMPLASGRNIPLLCTVCPETPHFSDVSHLLTHIASKGHLHHETQTRLKSHQDVSASVALTRYEHWYKENGIEALLVDRLEAKQAKEAARRKRTRTIVQTAASSSSKATKKKPKHSNDECSSGQKIKTEEEIFPDPPFFPGPLHSPENDVEDLVPGSDTLSLKGQVWPGMGKMDLANEEMRRTRNQRKPKSVIDRMRRTSEGIEPTQVIMTSELQIERVKDVYDETSSPVPGQEEATPPRKVAKPKRKRSEPLSEVSVNVPREAKGRGARNHSSGSTKTSKSKTLSGHDQPDGLELRSTMGTLRSARVLFTGENMMPSPFDDSFYNSPTQREYKFVNVARQDLRSSKADISRLHIRDHHGVQALNPIAQSNMFSPILSSKSTHGHNLSQESYRFGRQEQVMASQKGIGKNTQSILGNANSAFAFNDNSTYSSSARPSRIIGGPFGSLDHEQFCIPQVDHVSIKQENYAHSLSNESLSKSTHPYLNISGDNPLLSHSRGLFDAYEVNTPSQPLNCLGFTPINRDDRKHSYDEHDQKPAHFCNDDPLLTKGSYETISRSDNIKNRDPDYQSIGLWGSEAHEDDLGFQNELNAEHIEI